MSDKTRILEHLEKHGSITPLEALDMFGCYRLGARVHELRKAGYAISTEIVEGTDRNGERMRYAKYTMEK